MQPGRITQLVRSIRPHAQTLRELGGGEMNTMVAVDSKEVVRVPRIPSSKERLAYESRVLEHIAGTTTLSVPTVIELDPDNAYSVLSYIEGDVVSSAHIQALGLDAKHALAGQLAQFMSELNHALTARQLTTWADELMPRSDTWEAYYQRVYDQTERNRYHARYCRQFDLTARRLEQVSAQHIAIHGDLHASNLLFRGDRLTAVIDFGDCEAGTIYHELRPLISLGEDIVQLIVDQLDQSFGSVDVALVRDLAILHELSVLARTPMHDHASHHRVGIARENLELWLGAGWDQADDIRAIIFDCFGVLTSEDWIPFRQKHFASQSATRFAQGIMGKFVRGDMSTDEFVDTIADSAGVTEADVRDSLNDTDPDTLVFRWIQAHASRYKISMLSNIGSNRLGEIFEPTQLQLFDDIVLSYDVGMAKPDRRIYQLAAERLGVTPAQCVFVDDKAEFCQAARNAGMHAIHYRTYHQFEAAVKAYTMGA